MKKPMRLEGTIPVVFFREGRSVIAYSPAVDLSTCGTTVEKAGAAFKEATQLFFEELVAMGTLEIVLKDLGWRIVRNEWVAPKLIARKNEKISIALV
jgi:hypothetical protein